MRRAPCLGARRAFPVQVTPGASPAGGGDLARNGGVGPSRPLLLQPPTLRVTDRPPHNQLSSVGKAQTRKPRLRVPERLLRTHETERAGARSVSLSCPCKAGWRPELLPPLRTPPPGRPLCDLWGGSPAGPLWGVTPFPHLVSPLASDTTKEPPPFRGRKRGCRVRRPSELRRWPSPCSLRPRAGPSADGLSHPKIHGRG